MNKEITVLVTTFNKKDTIKDCINSLLNLNYEPRRVLIMDNGSTDGTYEILKEYGDKIDLFQSPIVHSNLFNLAFDKTKTELIAVTDADCVVAPNWLDELIKGFNEENVVATAGYCGTPKNTSFLQKLIGMEMDNRFDNLPHRLYRAPTMNLCLKTDIARKVKFDEKQGVAIETDFGFRLSKYGKIIYTSKAKIWHYHRSSLKNYFSQQKNQAKWGPRLVFKHKRRAISDPITSLGMTIQIPLLMAIIGFLVLSFFSQIFIYPTLFFFLFLFLIYLSNIIRINPPPLYYLVFPFFFLYRTIAWTTGVIEGSFLLLSDKSLR